MQILPNYRVDPQLKQVFDGLSPFIRESIVHSGKQVRDVQDLQQCARHLQQQDER